MATLKLIFRNQYLRTVLLGDCDPTSSPPPRGHRRGAETAREAAQTTVGPLSLSGRSPTNGLLRRRGPAHRDL